MPSEIEGELVEYSGLKPFLGSRLRELYRVVPTVFRFSKTRYPLFPSIWPGIAIAPAFGMPTRKSTDQGVRVEMPSGLTRREGVDRQMAGIFVDAIARHRDWSREAKGKAIPA